MARGEKVERDGPTGRAHGRISYLQIPAADGMESAAFYERVFGWRIERPHASFEAPGVIGQWVSDRAPAADAGILVWVHVDRLDTALELVTTAGGEVLDPPQRDGATRRLATIRDPGGNAIGLVEHESG